MDRTPVNPSIWSLKFGFNQAEIFTGATRQLVCSGQTATDADGNPQHPGNMRGQFGLALDNLATLLAAAGMSFANVTRLGIYTTDMDEALKHFDLLGARLGSAGVTPPSTLVGVTRLALPSLMIEIEATAMD
ncbi:RidA family protein [Paracoccus pacificus]|uniref:RidA family protein n=1 Tax=Paracoccus pacificus TaxID=1463598 RepID=A0ABW4R9J5_9RHOB